MLPRMASAFGLLVFLVLAGGFVAIVVLLVLAQQRRARERQQAFAALAAKHGWTWVARDDRWNASFEGPPFGAGSRQASTNVLTGLYAGRPSVAFDYHYETTSTTHTNGRTQTHRESHDFSVVATDTGTAFPLLSVVPEGFLGRLVGRITGSDIELESEDFNRMFTVHSTNRRFASDVLHPRMMQLLMHYPQLAWRLQNGWLIVYHAGTHTPAEVEAKLPV
ncbi:MAG: hypothetical protein JWO46_1894, partial [Nocardioidaceae bacterium]|nr:hypothetical protein [Nocardioidaceae bacterium]